MFELTGRHIFIAGGSRGLGAATARLAGKLGARVSLTYNANRDAAEKIVQEIRAAGGTAQAYAAQIEEDASIAAAVDQAVKDLGPLAGMVVSSGIFEHRKIEELDTEFWERTMSINLRGTMLAVKAAARHMRQAGKGGSIVIYTSTAGQSGGGGGASAYSVSKAGQIVFARCMAHELGPDGIRVNSLAPAWTETEMAAPHLERLGRENVSKQFALRRIGQADDVAKATCYLLSDASGFVTGTCHSVDGGMAMRG